MTRQFSRATAIVGVTVLLSVGALAGQTQIVAPQNKYSPAEDVQLGREASAEVQKQLPMLNDQTVDSFVESLGQRLVAAIPREFSHPEFRYTFQVVNVREINAFALPGGPMYVNRGMISQARTQGEVASVIAHEISHVALRHGTAQATKATKYEIGTMLGAVLGSIIGGRTGNVVAGVTQFGLGTAFLKFSREYERQADLLGSHIMADAGFDPREMASMFQTIQKQGGSGGPEFLSDHPDPGNRAAAITKEAALLQVRNPVRDTSGFTRARSRLSQMPAAPTTEQATRSGAGRSTGRSTSPSNGGRLDPRSVAPPSSTYTTYNEGDVFRISVPSNWRELPSNDSVTFAPDGGYGDAEGQGIITHGLMIGAQVNESHDLRTASDELVASLAQGNPNMGRPSGYARANMAGRQWLRTTIPNRSPGTNEDEQLAVYTTQLNDGNLFYAVGVAPVSVFSQYEATVRRVLGTIQFAR
ncbi:MAG TPA: M48 family metallopeptidase [Vicinamibacterales bacterium]|nr:M48 family metallopeptidase [Vicinamibacterales bacterium]